MFDKMKDLLKANHKTLVFTEGEDERIQQAAAQLQQEQLLSPVLLGNPDAVLAKATENDIDLSGITIIDPATYADMDDMVQKMAELRRGKMSEEECRAALQKNNYFGTMYVKMGYAAGLLGGATYSTADTVRPALQIVKTKPGCNIVSSCFIMSRMGTQGEERYVMADCAINLDPTADELVEITTETVGCARLFGVQPQVALLSYSSFGSGKGPSADKVREAVAKLKDTGADFPFDGELQFDAAFAPSVAKTKAPSSPVAGKANTFIFPNIDSGNIGYKIAQRLGGFEAFGPILLGLNAPINDLSRGCTADEVYKMAIITAASAV